MDPVKSSRSYKFPIVIALLVLSLVGNIYLWTRSPKAVDAQADAANQVKKIVADVGRVIVLPQNETPTVATVSDLAPLKGQPFFSNAALGDQVLIYTAARKVILWRPGEGKIIEVAPLTVNSTPAPSATTPTATTTKK